MTIQKIESQSHEAQSVDIKAENITRLKSLFPELLTESANGVAINVNVLKQLVGDAAITDVEEKYGLNWHGKRRARQLALTPSTGTLRPCQDESVDWDTTQNLMIEGDNLEVLKLLQKSYAGKVKLIYIDPPYNTGKDFVYPDNFQDNIKNYLELTGQIEGGKKISSNSEASGRFHTDWLNMMYPRLKLAKNLLREDGVIFISIDDSEVARLRTVSDEIFGDENFVANVIWEKKFSPQNDAKWFSDNHDHILIYAKNKDVWRPNKIARSEENNSRFSNPDNDPRGVWASSDMTVKTYNEAYDYPVTTPSGKEVYPTKGRCWSMPKGKFQDLIVGNRVWFGKGGDNIPRFKSFLNELEDGVVPLTIWKYSEVGHNQEATQEVRGLDISGFDSPKPVRLLRRVLEIGTISDGIVLDFFAGSGTTAHAVMAQNAAADGTHRYVLVQLPEPLDPENKDQKTAADYCDKLGKPRTVAELTKERLRRAGVKVRADNPMFTGDTGFRVFKLDTSNIRAWNPDRDNLVQTLIDHEEHILPGRTEADIVYELLLKLGLDLCVPIESRTFAGKTVGAIGGGVLLTCLAERITTKEVEALAQGIVAWRKELAPAGDTTCVFRDSAFENDIAKSNLAAILEQYGIANVRSL